MVGDPTPEAREVVVAEEGEEMRPVAPLMSLVLGVLVMRDHILR